MYDPLIKREDLGKKPKKSTDPDSGTYEVGKSHKYLEANKGPSQKMSPAPIIKFYDQAIKISRHIPAPTHYKVDQKSYSRLSTSPPSIRIKRH